MGTVDNLHINKIVIIRFLFLSVVLLWKMREIKLSICLQLKMVLLRNINVLSVLMEELLQLDKQLRHKVEGWWQNIDFRLNLQIFTMDPFYAKFIVDFISGNRFTVSFLEKKLFVLL